MPIKTPEYALTLDELPTAKSWDRELQAIVNTASGVKKMPIADLLKPYSLMIGSYHFYARGIPSEFAVPLLGGLLDPKDFVDDLETLKRRVPEEWVTTDGFVRLPLVMDELLQMDLALTPGKFQLDAMQKITGYFFVNDTGLNAGGSFSGHYSSTGSLYHRAGGVRGYYSMDSSRETRTSDRTRERTLNAVLCIFAGQVKSQEVVRCWIIDPVWGQPMGWYLDLAKGRDGKAVGFNGLIMTDTEPVELSQQAMAESWRSATSSDPMGIALQVKGRDQFDFCLLRLDYRTFRVKGYDLVFTCSKDGLKVTGKSSYLVFKGLPSFSDVSMFGSTYGVHIDSTSVTVGGQLLSFSINTISQVQIRVRVKEDNVLLSVMSENKGIDESWIETNIRDKWDATKGLTFNEWKKEFAPAIYNGTNKDGLDAYVKTRFYLKAEGYEMPVMSQKDLFTTFQQSASEDGLGIFDALHRKNFSLSQSVTQEGRTFFIDGKKMTFFADMQGWKWKAESGDFIGYKMEPMMKQDGASLDGQKNCVLYPTDGRWIFGNSWQERELSFPQDFPVRISVKGTVVVVCFGRDVLGKSGMSLFTSTDKNWVSTRNNLPVEWGNTLNHDSLGDVEGTELTRFYMKGA